MSSASKVVLMQSGNPRDRHGGGRHGVAAGGRSSSQEMSAHYRVRLKLAALAYVGTRHGSDARAELLLASVTALCGAALSYYGALTSKSWTRVEDRTLRWEGMTSADASDMSGEEVQVLSARIRLKLACVSYESTRHGADAHTEFTRAGIAELCDSAIHYCQTLLGPGRGDADEGGTHDGAVVDRTLHLDDGR